SSSRGRASPARPVLESSETFPHDRPPDRVRRRPRVLRRSSAACGGSITSDVMVAGALRRYPPAMPAEARPVGSLLREWRQRRRMSQLDLAVGADVSARHLSFVETGRSVPSREMVMHLAERLEVPLRARNALLLAAGYAPAFRERPLSDPALDAAREAV